MVVTILIGLVVSRHKTSPSTKSTDSRGSYVALGDSVAAGVGLDEPSDSSACERSKQSYANQVATGLSYSLKNIACSGATIPAGIAGKQDVNNLLVDPQLTQLFALPTPKLVSLTIGANDANWTQVLGKCYTAECGSAEDSDLVTASLNTVSSSLNALLEQLQSHYTTNAPRVLVTGYYQVFPNNLSAGCTDLNGIDASELAWGKQFQATLNTTIQTAVAAHSIATYIPIDFSGHELCTTDPWVQGLSNKAPYHPTAEGQKALSKQIISALRAH